MFIVVVNIGSKKLQLRCVATRNELAKAVEGRDGPQFHLGVRTRELGLQDSVESLHEQTTVSCALVRALPSMWTSESRSLETSAGKWLQLLPILRNT